MRASASGRRGGCRWISTSCSYPAGPGAERHQVERRRLDRRPALGQPVDAQVVVVDDPALVAHQRQQRRLRRRPRRRSAACPARRCRPRAGAASGARRRPPPAPEAAGSSAGAGRSRGRCCGAAVAGRAAAAPGAGCRPSAPGPARPLRLPGRCAGGGPAPAASGRSEAWPRGRPARRCRCPRPSPAAARVIAGRTCVGSQRMYSPHPAEVAVVLVPRIAARARPHVPLLPSLGRLHPQPVGHLDRLVLLDHPATPPARTPR